MMVVDRDDSTRQSTTAPAGTTDRHQANCEEIEPPPLLADQPESQELACERAQAFSSAEFRASTVFRLRDFHGEHINIEGGTRQTWRPPSCDCVRLKVWWLGGSAAWGEGQRDLYSLPSMLARRAWEDGIALDIENRAMPTYTFNQEVHLFGELTTTEENPDLVISYGGANDVVFQALRHARGQGTDDSDIALLEQTFDDLLMRGIPVNPEQTSWSPDPQTLEGSLTDDLAVSLAERVVDRYTANLDLAERIAASIDRRFIPVWQPILSARSPSAGEAGVPPEILEGFETMQTVARELLPDRVVDQGDTLSQIDEDVFYDLFHTGERGAEISAESLYEILGPTLYSAAEQARTRNE